MHVIDKFSKENPCYQKILWEKFVINYKFFMKKLITVTGYKCFVCYCGYR